MPLTYTVTLNHVERFATKFVITEDGCWNWIKPPRTKDGRGAFGFEYKQHIAYRFLYQLIHWGLDGSKVLDHLCRNPRCVNPQHLEPVSPAENSRRYAKTITHCPRGHEYKDIPEWAKRNGRRYCNPCHAIREVKRRQSLAFTIR